MKTFFRLALTLWWLSALGAAEEPTLSLPAISKNAPGAGKKVGVMAPEYVGTEVHHMLYLPTDWRSDFAERRWPVIVEYTGNKYSQAGSTGEVEDAALGFGISGGRFIWVVLPYVSADHRRNETTWWGDLEATVNYAKLNIPKICAQYGGDPKAVVLCGFSRGAIGVNYIGLHDDEIARLWCGFVSHDHYDGVRGWSDWGAPLELYRRGARERLARIHGRPVLISASNQVPECRIALVRDYLNELGPIPNFTFLDVQMDQIFPSIPNSLIAHPHTDRWLLKESQDRRAVWDWLARSAEGLSADCAD